MMDKNATITHNERLRDRHGHLRQFDVVIRAKVGGHNILGVIECKNLNKRVGTPEVDAFVTKARDVNANITLLASKKGFTKPALEKAKDYVIGTISLLSENPKECGFSIGNQCYATTYMWPKCKVELAFVKKDISIKNLSAKNIENITWRGSKIIDFFHKELVTTYKEGKEEGWYTLNIKFDKPRKFIIASKTYMVKGAIFKALRACEKKQNGFNSLAMVFMIGTKTK